MKGVKDYLRPTVVKIVLTMIVVLVMWYWKITDYNCDGLCPVGVSCCDTVTSNYIVAIVALPYYVIHSIADKIRNRTVGRTWKIIQSVILLFIMISMLIGGRFLYLLVQNGNYLMNI